MFHQAWKNCLAHYRVAIETARSTYFSCIIENNQNNHRQRFHTINSLLNVDGASSLTSFDWFSVKKLTMFTQIFVVPLGLLFQQ